MAVINLYKIDGDKKIDFFEKLTDAFEELAIKRVKVIENGHEEFFDMGLYYDSKDEDSRITWEWVIECFEAEGDTLTKKNPQGIVTIEYGDDVYAVSFSYAYYVVDKYCDRDFPFRFGRRLKYKNIKTTALTNPNLQKNKTVNNFIDYNDINFDSGEAYTKLAAFIEEKPEFELFKQSIEFGNSIKLSCDEPSLERIASIILYVENIVKTQKEVVFIPRFDKVKDKDLVEELTEDMLTNAGEGNISIDFSEYQVHATNVIFNDCDEYELSYYSTGAGTKRQKVDDINMFEIRDFAVYCDTPLREIIEHGKVSRIKDGIKFTPEKLLNHAFVTNEEKSAIFQEGCWYIYNNDYLKYMNDSIAEIETLRISEYDFVTSKHIEYLDMKYEQEKDDGLYSEMSKEQIKQKLRKKYYSELFFNEYMVQRGFTNMDRVLEHLGNHKFETADLYKEGCLYTVKIGASSSKLCYAVDQSIISLELYHRGKINLVKDVKEFALLLIFNNRSQLPLVKGKPDITKLKMIILKNKLDYWKKEVRLKGYTPKIYINYMNNN